MSGFRIQGVARAAAMTLGACLGASVVASLVASLVALPAQAARGGPDTFGYTWRDDREVGVTYERFDFTAPPTGVFVTEPGPDGSTDFITLPWAFPFYGRNYTQVALSSDGWMSFTRAFSADNSPSVLPDPDGPPAMIAPLWENLSLGLRGSGDFLRYQVAPDKIVFEWFRTRVEATGEDATFQVWLFPNGRIRFQYLNVAGAHPGATIGIEEELLTSGLMIMSGGVGVDSFLVRSKSAVDILPPAAADCSLPIACGEVLDDTVRRNPDRIATYGTCGAGYGGAEIVRTLRLTELSHVVAGLTAGSVENELFVLPACTELSCLGSGDAWSQDFLPPGDYVLAVDAITGNTPQFTLGVGCESALVPVACGVVTGTLDARARVDQWPCLSIATPGSERFYLLNLAATSDLTLTLNRSDLAVVISELEGFPSKGARCISAGWTKTWATDLPPGDYVISVDGLGTGTLDFTLDIACSAPATMPITCGAIVGGVLSPLGSLDGWSCGASPLPGGEALYEIVLPTLATLTITLNADAPAEIVLLDGALEGPSSCIARDTAFLSYPNAPPGRYVIVVDSVAGANTTLTVECDEPVGSVCTPWEWHDGDVPITGLTALPVHGDPAFYELATPPPADDPGWKSAPDPATIGYARPSDICGHACLTAVDFTYFRSTIRLPQTVTSFRLSFGTIDDGLQVRLNGQPVGVGLLGRNVIVDLTGSPFLRRGQLNEVLIVQEDDCCSWNELSGTACLLVGFDPPCGATITPPAPVDGLPGDSVTLTPIAADVQNCFDVVEYRWRSGATILRDWDADPSFTHVLGYAAETLTVEVRCRRDPACTAAGDVLVTVPPCVASVTAADAQGCPGTTIDLFATAWDLQNCPDPPEFRWWGSAGVLQDWSPADAYSHVAGAVAEDITIEVRCPRVPTCSASDLVSIAIPGNPVLPDVTPALRARKQASSDIPILYWPTATVPALGGHFHVYRATDSDHAFLRVNDDSALIEWVEPDPDAEWLLFYDVRSADLCERESAD